MNFKRPMTVVLAGAMLFSFAACNKKDDKSYTEKQGEITVEACQNTIDKFLTACKEGNVDDILLYGDDSYYIDEWNGDKEDLSRLIKYVSSDINWEFNLDDMEDSNTRLFEENDITAGSAINFNVAWSYKQWNLAEAAYIQSIEETPFVAPMESSVDEMYSTLDSISNDIPVVAEDKMLLTEEDGYIRVKSNVFFENLFSDYLIFKNAEDPTKYIGYMIGDGTEEHHKTRMHPTTRDVSEEEVAIADHVFDLLKEKKDYEVYQYILNSGNKTMVDALENNYFAKNVSELSDAKKTDIEKQYEDMMQIVVEYEIDSGAIRTAEIYRFYNTPTNGLGEKPELKEFISSHNAYYNSYIFSAAEYRIDKPMDALNTLSDYITHQ